MDTIFVMKDVELPADTQGPKTRYPFETMAVGDAFFLPGRKASKFSPYAGKFGRRTERKFQVRDVFMTKKMDGDKQVGWNLATSGDTGAVAGCIVKRLPDAAPAAAAAQEPAKADPAPAAAATPPTPAPAAAKAPQPAAAKAK